MNQVYNNPLIIRNVEFKEYLTEKEALEKINEFRFSDAGQALPDNKKISLKRIANYIVTHPNFDVSDDHVLVREGSPIIFTSKNYKKLKYEKPAKRLETDEMRNNQLLDDDNDNGDGISTLTENITKSNKLKIKHQTNGDHNGSNGVVISLPKKKKKKKTINVESNTTMKNDFQGIGLIHNTDIEKSNIDPSMQSGFNDDSDEKNSLKKNEAVKESKINSNVEVKSENEVTIRTSKKRTQKIDKINAKKIKVDPSNDSAAHKKSNETDGKVIGKVKDASLKNKKKSKGKTNFKAIQGIVSSGDKISKVKNDKKESGSKNNKSISSKETINKDSANTSNTVTINMKKKKKKNMIS